MTERAIGFLEFFTCRLHRSCVFLFMPMHCVFEFAFAVSREADVGVIGDGGRELERRTRVGVRGSGVVSKSAMPNFIVGLSRCPGSECGRVNGGGIGRVR